MLQRPVLKRKVLLGVWAGPPSGRKQSTDVTHPLEFDVGALVADLLRELLDHAGAELGLWARGVGDARVMGGAAARCDVAAAHE